MASPPRNPLDDIDWARILGSSPAESAPGNSFLTGPAKASEPRNALDDIAGLFVKPPASPTTTQGNTLLAGALPKPGLLSPPDLRTRLANALLNFQLPPPSGPPGLFGALWPSTTPSRGNDLDNALAANPYLQSAKTKRVFISFRAEDKNKVNGLRLLNANDNFDIEFYDESVRTPYDSNDPAYIKRCIREKIRRTKVTVCMVSEWTYTSRWVDWELEESIANRNNIICMGFKDGPTSLQLPNPIRELGIGWWLWDHDHLHKLISETP
jgi:hypothetical protein